MKKKLFEQLDRDFLVLCEYPNSEYAYGLITSSIIFLYHAGVIDANKYQFLFRSCRTVALC